MSLTSECYGLSDLGHSRQNNEDVWMELPSAQFYLLADGLGGHQAGEVAAKEAVLVLSDTIDNLFNSEERPSPQQAITALRHGINNANTWVKSLSTKYAELSGMGTTLCCCLVLSPSVILAHVGDSRIYRFRSSLERLSHDHVKLQMVEGKPKKILTKAVGATLTIQPEIQTTDGEAGDLFLLCSDGLTDSVPDSLIEEVLRENKPLKETAFSLIELAKEKGGHDNITLVLIRLS